MSDKKKIKDSKLGQWLKEKAPKVLDTVGDLLPDKGVLGVVKNLLDRNEVEPHVRMEFDRMQHEFEVELTSLYNADRADARAREVAFVQATGKRDWLQAVIAIVGLVFSGFMIFCGVTGKFDDREVYFHLLGIAEGAMLLPIFNYFFGSSKGSKDKAEQLRQK